MIDVGQYQHRHMDRKFVLESPETPQSNLHLSLGRRICRLLGRPSGLSVGHPENPPAI